MPITIRDKPFDRRIAREAKRRGGISKTAAVKSLASERLDQLDTSSSVEQQQNSDANQKPVAASTTG